MVEVVVEYEYEALHEDELTLRLGDVIKNVRRIAEDGWMEGDLNGKRGLFPDNFVKEVKKEEHKSKEEPKEAKEAKEVKEETPIQRRASGNVANLVQRISTYGIPAGGIGLQPHSQPRASKKKARKRQCKVLFEYVPQNEDELELKVGDIIEITEEVEEGWWSGSMNGKSGLFPSNFVKEMDSSEETESTEVPDEPDKENRDGASSPTSPLPGNGIMAQPKKIKGIGFGDIFREGSVKLRASQKGPSEHTEKTERPIPSLPSATKPSPPSNPEPMKAEKEPECKGKVKEYCKAIFSYEATNEDELDLKEGEVVLILSKDTGEPGWWRGEVNGKEGVFPDNFTTLLPETDKEAPSTKSSIKASPKQETEEKPKKPPPPSKSTALKPEVLSADKKQPRPEEKVVKPLPEKPAKPAGPIVPPKKPVPPNKSLLRPSFHTKHKMETSPLYEQSQRVNLFRSNQKPLWTVPRRPLNQPSKDTDERGEKVNEVVDAAPSAQNSFKTPVSSPLPSMTPKAVSTNVLTPEPKAKVEKEEEKTSELEELKAQMKELVLSVELLRSKQSRELSELRKELDDERLKRMTLQGGCKSFIVLFLAWFIKGPDIGGDRQTEEACTINMKAGLMFPWSGPEWKATEVFRLPDSVHKS
ncbi:hypothetical protein DNTS_021107 [Danionella cerebrum]|uniref:Osteoclast-stimulating factor 1 n=1 Tax=Danionella cerebrum TaxID=2873325 RepID=A0A553QT33_9TELE|nr:hypothetical protein DNTS_021107 [Danionella translucida]